MPPGATVVLNEYVLPEVELGMRGLETSVPGAGPPEAAPDAPLLESLVEPFEPVELPLEPPAPAPDVLLPLVPKPLPLPPPFPPLPGRPLVARRRWKLGAVTPGKENRRRKGLADKYGIVD